MNNSNRQKSINTYSSKKKIDSEIKNPISSQLNKEIKIKEEYETQLKIPKPILIDIFQRCGFENLMKISLISKQFYFLVKSDNFWIKILKSTDLSEEEIENERKTKKLVEIYKDTTIGWDVKRSNQKLLQFNGNHFVHQGGQGVAIALTKKAFVSGEDNYLFVFDAYFEGHLNGCGLSVYDWQKKKKIYLFFNKFFFLLKPMF